MPTPSDVPANVALGSEERPVRHGAGRSVATLVALVVIYYALPVGQLPSDRVTVVLSVVGLLAGSVALTWLAAIQIRRQMQASDEADARVQSLLAIVYLAVVLFATGYFALATSTEDQFVELDTKTDALYFTMTTLSTVGYGDVHAAGQAARAIVTVQIVFNLAVIGALVSVFTARLRQRAARPPSRTGAG